MSHTAGRSHFCASCLQYMVWERLNSDALCRATKKRSQNTEIWEICYVSWQSNLNYNFACRVFNLSLYLFKSRKIPMLRISYSARLTWQSTLFLLFFLSLSLQFSPWLIKSHESNRDLNVCTRKAKHCCRAILTFHAFPNPPRLICKPFTRVSVWAVQQTISLFSSVHWHFVSKLIRKLRRKKQIFDHLCIILCDFSQTVRKWRKKN